MLETALSDQSNPSNAQLLVEAVYWLEAVYAMELQSRAADNDTSPSSTSSSSSSSSSSTVVGGMVPSHLLKNAGLAHMHLVRSGDALKDSVRLPLPKIDLFQSLAGGTTVAWPTDGRQATATTVRCIHPSIYLFIYLSIHSIIRCMSTHS